MVINTVALEPLFAPHEEPNFLRVKAVNGHGGFGRCNWALISILKKEL